MEANNKRKYIIIGTSVFIILMIALILFMLNDSVSDEPSPDKTTEATNTTEKVSEETNVNTVKLSDDKIDAPEQEINKTYDEGETFTAYLHLYKASADIDCTNLQTNLLPRSIAYSSSAEAMALEITSHLFEDLDPSEFQEFNKSYVNYPKGAMNNTKSKLLAATLDTSLFGEEPFIQPHIKGITVADGIATVDMPIYYFTQEENCNAFKFENTVTNTLKQFDGINEVVVTVEGEEMWCDTSNCVNQRIFDLTKSSEFIEVAEPGDGVTHLTRSALGSYLLENSFINPIVLTTEEEIFVEDTLQNIYGGSPLKPGDSITISRDTITRAIDEVKSVSGFSLGDFIQPTSISTSTNNFGGYGVQVQVHYLDVNGSDISGAQALLTIHTFGDSGFELIETYTMKYLDNKGYYTFYHTLPQWEDGGFSYLDVTISKESFLPQTQSIDSATLVADGRNLSNTGVTISFDNDTYEADITLKKPLVKGDIVAIQEKTDFINEQGDERIGDHILPEMTIDSISLNGSQVNSAEIGDTITLKFEEPISVGSILYILSE